MTSVMRVGDHYRYGISFLPWRKYRPDVELVCSSWIGQSRGGPGGPVDNASVQWQERAARTLVRMVATVLDFPDNCRLHTDDILGSKRSTPSVIEDRDSTLHPSSAFTRNAPGEPREPPNSARVRTSLSWKSGFAGAS